MFGDVPKVMSSNGGAAHVVHKHRRIHRRGRAIGYVRAEYAAEVQAGIDMMERDGG